MTRLELDGETLPVLASGQLVLFPGMRSVVHLRSARALAALRAARERRPGCVALFASRIESPHEPGPEQLHEVGTVARVLGLDQCPSCARWTGSLEGVARVRRAAWLRLDPYREACCARLAERPEPPSQLLGLASSIHQTALQIHARFPACVHATHAVECLGAAPSPQEVVGAAGSLLLHLATFQRQQLLELEPLGERLRETLYVLHERLARTDGRAHRLLH